MKKIFFLLTFFIFANSALSQSLAKIGGISDFSTFNWSGSGDLVQDSNVCVFSETGNYKVTIQGSNSGFSLLYNGTSIPYSVKWNDASNTTNNVEISHNIPLMNQTGANTSDEDCDGGTNANLEISFDAANLGSSPSGNYTGYITIIIEATN